MGSDLSNPRKLFETASGTEVPGLAVSDLDGHEQYPMSNERQRNRGTKTAAIWITFTLLPLRWVTGTPSPVTTMLFQWMGLGITVIETVAPKYEGWRELAFTPVRAVDRRLRPKKWEKLREDYRLDLMGNPPEYD